MSKKLTIRILFYIISNYLVTNAMFAPGNSGGPIVNSSGEVVGMVSWIDRRGPALSFAIPFDVIQKATKE